MGAVLFCNIGWMNRYEGLDGKPDKIVGGGRFVTETGHGHEACNFVACRDGYVYGHVETSQGRRTGKFVSRQSAEAATMSMVWRGGLMHWFGADPGGIRKRLRCFGVALLREDGTFETCATDCAHNAFRWLTEHTNAPTAIGIDCPLWWSAWKSAERQVDVLLRRKYRDRIGQSVQSINSLRGAALVQGIMLGYAVRARFPDVHITETHPKALLKAMHLSRATWSEIANTFKLEGSQPETPDQLDALLSAAVARNGSTGLWKDDLTKLARGMGEMDPRLTFFGPVNYFWFEPIADA
jgi:hypothetical protein